MSEKKKAERHEHLTSEGDSENLNSKKNNDAGTDPKEKHPSHSTGYIKDKKTGKWKIVNPAGSMAYNYLYRDEFPDD